MGGLTVRVNSKKETVKKSQGTRSGVYLSSTGEMKSTEVQTLGVMAAVYTLHMR